MRSELDEKLKKALGSPRPLEVERFTNHVMEQLQEELRKEKQPIFLRGVFHRLIVFNWSSLRALISSHLAQIRQSRTFAGKRSLALKVTAGFTAAAVIVILTLIFLPNYDQLISLETPESSEMLNETLPRYVLNDRINAHIAETRPCDILPPVLD